MPLKIQAWDRYKNRLMDSIPSPLDNWISNGNIYNSSMASKHILVSMIYFDSDISKSTNTVVYFDLKAVIYFYACGIRMCFEF
jgi:hypothetical protein